MFNFSLSCWNQKLLRKTQLCNSVPHSHSLPLCALFQVVCASAFLCPSVSMTHKQLFSVKVCANTQICRSDLHTTWNCMHIAKLTKLTETGLLKTRCWADSLLAIDHCGNHTSLTMADCHNGIHPKQANHFDVVTATIWWDVKIGIYNEAACDLKREQHILAFSPMLSDGSQPVHYLCLSVWVIYIRASGSPERSWAGFSKQRLGNTPWVCFTL